ncbi:MAG TPA: amino acid ABC transporter permease [Dehalococcoidia bacterium]|nr:amino acid ABC transporter permease [Dehalococcoidia bacterium]
MTPLTGRPSALALPVQERAWRWSQANLFSSRANSVLTVVTVAFMVFAGYQVARFVFATAEWEVVEANRGLFFIGRFPRDEVWRVWVILHIASALAGLSWGLWGSIGPRLGAIIAAALVPVYILLLDGNALIWTTTCLATFMAGYLAGQVVDSTRLREASRAATVPAWLLGFAVSMYLLREVPDRLWGGLLLTMVLAIVSIVLSFPFGVLLAIGRASTFPVIRLFCIVYIEVIRGVPLITVLFMAHFVLPLAMGADRDVFGFPVTGFGPSVVVRAMAGLTAFSAAYVAETVRGGLRAVPHGQIEAAQALGLGGVRILALIVLPQALRAVIPALVGQFISLFKDTSLVVIIGVTELLRAAQVASAQPAFAGLQAEALLFAALLYWVVCFSMSRASQQIERNLAVSER